MGSSPRVLSRLAIAPLIDALRPALPALRRGSHAALEPGGPAPAPRALNLGRGSDLDRGPRFSAPAWIDGLQLPSWMPALSFPAPSRPAWMSSVALPARITWPSRGAAASETDGGPRADDGAAAPRPSLPGGSLSAKHLIGAASLCMVLAGIGALTRDAGSIDAAQRAQAAARPVPTTGPLASSATAAPADPFNQTRLNQELRTLRSSLTKGESARNLTILADGTMGTMAVKDGAAESIMAQGTEFVREPIADWPTLLRSHELNLRAVHGVAPNKVLATAQSLFKLAPSQLVSLKLEPSPKRPSVFIWTATYRDPEQSVVYADREGASVSTVLPG